VGYTHFFNQQAVPTQKQWKAIMSDAKKIIAYAKESNIPLAYEYDEPQEPPRVTSELIRFNGVLGGGHETFYLPRVMEPGYRGEKFRFNFCKTARKPYDAVVGAILISMNDHAPGCWDIASDGDRSDWADCIDLYKQAIGKEAATDFLDPVEEEVQ
jgi:hypothetical protein